MEKKELNIKENIAQNIAYYRKKNKMSQKSLANKINSKVTTISTWERGASTPDIDLLFKICKIFHISITSLLGGDSIEGNSKMMISGLEKEIILAYRKADEIDQKIVHRTLHLPDDAHDTLDIEQLTIG